ncbi:hypothetical protein ACWEVD_04295 [Nocardia thailandica]|uniref:hypothetical protein n=1 Tax=Nocardia thailandica TaxID=257275 RepID=UPI0012FC3F62|nr:hypothetical protein [Nocardia thailandica]
MSRARPTTVGAMLACSLAAGVALTVSGCRDESHVPDLPAHVVSTTPMTTAPVPPAGR